MLSIPLEEILKLAVEERLLLAEQIWDSIAAHPDALPLPDAHRTELDRRFDQPASWPNLTWEELSAHLRLPTRDHPRY
jgi:putative addiction module component (TIGR02574 family)